MNQFKTSIVGAICSFSLYILLVFIIRTINPKTIIFFFTCIYIVIFSIGCAFYLIIKQKWTYFISLSVTLNIALLTFIFAVFGPIFIDRSISYHVAFIVSESENINPTVLEESWKGSVFQKRFEDGISGGMLIHSGDGTYKSTQKAKFFTKIMLWLGKISNSTQEYEVLKGIYSENIQK